MCVFTEPVVEVKTLDLTDLRRMCAFILGKSVPPGGRKTHIVALDDLVSTVYLMLRNRNQMNADGTTTVHSNVIIVAIKRELMDLTAKYLDCKRNQTGPRWSLKAEELGTRDVGYTPSDTEEVSERMDTELEMRKLRRAMAFLGDQSREAIEIYITAKGNRRDGAALMGVSEAQFNNAIARAFRDFRRMVDSGVYEKLTA